MITFSQAREYFSLGVITGFSIVPGIVPGTWNLFIEGREGKTWTLQNSHKEYRDFKTVEAVLNVVTQICHRVSSIHVKVS